MRPTTPGNLHPRLTILTSFCNNSQNEGGFTAVTVDNDGGRTIANAIFSGPGLSVVNWDRTTIAGSVGTFTDDPFGIGDNATLTTGPASGALPVGDGSIDNQGGASQDYCSAGSKDASVIYAGLLLDAGYNGLRIEFVFATNKPVGISIFSFTNGLEQIARFNG
ncbi:hypothetical protein FPOAC1_006382 [Fusarium poae]|uniref:hypothetical protein n=1 Tax=Fusarium poae TaxID=36050 RepID=UPI001CE95E68|nr:hypothetical protein FPOAC1_006382 [Fusarium poae]KAG8673079.1 hypothetical protein FPOAC1_006382 [Fusarium poae]